MYRPELRHFFAGLTLTVATLSPSALSAQATDELATRWSWRSWRMRTATHAVCTSQQYPQPWRYACC